MSGDVINFLTRKSVYLDILTRGSPENYQASTFHIILSLVTSLDIQFGLDFQPLRKLFGRSVMHSAPPLDRITFAECIGAIKIPNTTIIMAQESLQLPACS